MKRGLVRCPIKRGGQTNGRTSDKGENYRISVLTESLVRLEYSEDGVFEDGQTQVVQNRDFGPVACEVVETEAVLDLHTEHLHLHFEKDLFCTGSTLYRTQGSVCSLWEPVALWRSAGDLKGDQSDNLTRSMGLWSCKMES